MRRGTLSTLLCPYSGVPFQPLFVHTEDDDGIAYGIVASEMGEFPIVAGILRLHLDRYRVAILERIRRRDTLGSLSIATDARASSGRGSALVNRLIGMAFESGLNSVGRWMAAAKRPFLRHLGDRRIVFTDAARALKLGEWQIYRFSMPAFLPTYPVLHMLSARGPVLDFGCGVGHAAFLMSRVRPDLDIICADYCFSFLFIAKHFFAPDASFICLDGNHLLPFNSEAIGTVFSSDALQLVDAKLGLVKEFERVVRKDGVIVFPHLHNRLSSASHGKPLTPIGYRGLFGETSLRVRAESSLVRDYFLNDVIDLAADFPLEALVDMRESVSLIASNDASVFQRRTNLWESYLSRIERPVINPIYRVTRADGCWILDRSGTDRFAKAFGKKDMECLPQRCTISGGSIDSVALLDLKKSDTSLFERLARSLIIVDAPERFAEAPVMARQ